MRGGAGGPMIHRYIFRVASVCMMSSAIEIWLGIITEEPIDLTEWDDLIPADGMSDEELSVVKRWLRVPRVA